MTVAAKGVFLSLILGGLFLFGCTASLNGAVNTPIPANSGRAVFMIADAAGNMGAVTSVKITVDAFRVRNETMDWATVSTTSHTYDLLALRDSNSTALLADANLAAGTYTQMRLDVSSVKVTDAYGEHDAKIPSGELILKGNLVVVANQTSTARFDFLVDRSLHQTGAGVYILTPVVHMTTRSNARVDVDFNGRVTEQGGELRDDIRMGMDEKGDFHEGREISANETLDIGSDGRMMVRARLG